MITKENRRRVARLPIASVPFEKWAWAEIIRLLPEDAIIAGVFHVPESNSVEMVVCSLSYPEIAEGEIIPRLTVKLDGATKTGKIMSHETDIFDFSKELDKI